MKFLEILVSLIIMFFPMLVYYYYAAYKKNLKENEKEIVSNLCLFITLFLSISILDYFDNPLYYLLATIPILFAYLYSKPIMIVFSSIIVTIFIGLSIDINYIFLVTANILYYFSYRYYRKTNKDRDVFTTMFCFITCFITVLFLTFNESLNMFNPYIILMVLIYAVIIYLCEMLTNKANEIINLHMTLKEFEHEKQIKTSLFKLTHEIKNPIAVCKGYLDMFDTRDVNKSDRYITILKGEIDRTLNLLSDFMQFTKIKVEKQMVDLNLLLEDVLVAITPLSEKYNTEVSFDTDDNLELNIDYSRMKQVIINIIKNSIEANKDKNNGKIIIKAYIENDKLYLIIKDNGVGMDKEVLDKLTVPFHTTKQNGNGLGICLSNEIVMAHGGSLNYKSSVGKGTTAKVVIPVK